MKLYTIYIKTVALTALMTLANPVHAFLDIKAVWNSFKQNSGAQIAIGAACTAAVASLGWMLYKRAYSKPVLQAKPTLNPSLPLIKGPKKDARWYNTREPKALRWSQSAGDVAHNKQSDVKVAATNLKNDILQKTNGAPVRNIPLLVFVNAPQGVTVQQGNVDDKHVTEQQAEAIKAYQSKVRSEANSAAKETISILLQRVDQEASRNERAHAKIERDNQKLDKLAEEVTNKALASAELDLKLERYQQESKEAVDSFTRNTEMLLKSIGKQLQEKEYSETEIAKIAAKLTTMKEEISSFHKENEDPSTIYTDNFKMIPHLIKPKEAYQALVDWKVLSEEQARDKAAKISTATINKRLNELMQEAAHNSDTKSVYRQLGWIFRNNITRDRYNRWLDGLPSITLDPIKRKELMDLFDEVRKNAEGKEEACRKKKEESDNKNPKVWNEPYEMVETLGEGKRATIITTSKTVDLGKKPLIINAVSIVGNKEPVKQEPAQEGYTKQLKAAADATATAASQVASAASNATAAACSAIASATTATYTAGVNLLKQASKATASPCVKTTEDKPQPKPAPQMDVSPAAAPKPTPSSAKATADKPVDPLSAAPVPENHLQAGPAQAPVVINAGPSIALTVTPSAAAAQAGAAGKSTESLQAEPQKGDALDRSYDMLRSAENLKHYGIVSEAKPMPCISGASGGASA